VKKKTHTKFCEKKRNKKKRFQHLAIKNNIFGVNPGVSAGINLKNSVSCFTATVVRFLKNCPCVGGFPHTI